MDVASTAVPRRPDLATPPGFFRHELHAMGTTVTVLVPETHKLAAASVALLFEEWEETFSRFRPSSELSRLNARAGRRVTVSPLMIDVVSAALAAAATTDGLFDPTLEPTMRRLGYDRSFELLPADRSAADAVPRPGATVGGHAPASTTGAWRAIEIDRERSTIRLPRGAGLDVGGIAKGMAVDAALALLVRDGAQPAGIEAGGDLAVAGLPPGTDAWPLRVELPIGGVDIAFRSGAVATSGISRRSWRIDGEPVHHLVDPRDGRPASTGLWSSTAFAATCGQAEVAAKTAFLLGERRAVPFLLRIGVPALLVRADGTQVTVGAWPGSEVSSDPGSRRQRTRPGLVRGIA